MEEPPTPLPVERISNFVRVERIASLLQNVSITLVAFFAFFYYLFPDQTRRIINNINPDRAWYFVGSWDGKTYINPRFHAARSRGEIPHDGAGLIPGGEILIPYRSSLIENLDREHVEDGIVGRNRPTIQMSRVVIALTGGKCVYVREARAGGTADVINRAPGANRTKSERLLTIWVEGVAIDCGSGY